MIHFVGAGPGAEDLITVRGADLLRKTDIIIYAGSLVNPALLGYAKAGCQIYNSAEMTLEEVIDVMQDAESRASTRSGFIQETQASMALSVNRWICSMSSASPMKMFPAFPAFRELRQRSMRSTPSPASARASSSREWPDAHLCPKGKAFANSQNTDPP